MQKENKTTYSYLPDFELRYSQEELEDIENNLSQQEEEIFKEILELEKQNDGKTDFMKDLLEAAKKGTMQYLDSMTDTNDSISSLKRSSSVSQWDDKNVKPINTSVNKSEAESFQSRTMSEANKSAIMDISDATTDGMSESGKKIFERYAEAYTQRTKSLTQLSTDGNSINRSDRNTNFETLSGLRGYRIGPVVAMPTAEQAKDGYKSYLDDHGGIGKNPSSWLYDENMNQFDTELAKQLGFKSPAEAEKWRKDNKLTVHEGPDGMFMVPRDVHSTARHDGYRSMMSKYLKGEITESDIKTYVIDEKVAYVKHEATERGCRMVKGIGFSAIKDVLKCAVVVICEETYNEFKNSSEEKFVDRMLRIFKNSWEHVKAKCSEIIKNMWSNIKGSILSEILTAINDFFFGTFKSIFKIIRQMWSSIKGAFKIIFSRDKNISFEERIFEASKILTAGVVGIIGFSLNELIEKSLVSIGVPFPFASLISECLSGLFAGVMSAIVIMLFDKFKKKFLTKSNYTQQLQLRSKSLCINSAQISVSSLRIDMKMYETYNFMGEIFSSMEEKYEHIQEQIGVAQKYQVHMTSEVQNRREGNKELKQLSNKYLNDDDF